MKGVVFDLYGPLAHFRKPDTTATQMTYPFITPLAVKGLVGAVLGIEDFVTGDKVGIRLMKPVKTVSQQMSMLGKETGSSFNRPTTIELVINPYYRIYYGGEEYSDRLAFYLEKEHAVYPTYLGAAYALTKPKLVSVFDTVEELQDINSVLEAATVVPTILIEEICFTEGNSYCRAGGFLYEYKGGRTFEKSIDFIYEQKGKQIRFKCAEGPFSINSEIRCFGREVVCLC
jgi:CRISPR-associated protein Cas5h